MTAALVSLPKYPLSRRDLEVGLQGLDPGTPIAVAPGGRRRGEAHEQAPGRRVDDPAGHQVVRVLEPLDRRHGQHAEGASRPDVQAALQPGHLGAMAPLAEHDDPGRGPCGQRCRPGSRLAGDRPSLHSGRKGHARRSRCGVGSHGQREHEGAAEDGGSQGAGRRGSERRHEEPPGACEVGAVGSAGTGVCSSIVKSVEVQRPAAGEAASPRGLRSLPGPPDLREVQLATAPVRMWVPAPARATRDGLGVGRTRRGPEVLPVGECARR